MAELNDLNPNDVNIIDPCPACGGRHVYSGNDQHEYICKGSFTKEKKMYHNQLKNNLTDSDWNMQRTTAEDERRETTIQGFTPNKQKGRIYKDSDMERTL